MAWRAPQSSLAGGAASRIRHIEGSIASLLRQRSSKNGPGGEILLPKFQLLVEELGSISTTSLSKKDISSILQTLVGLCREKDPCTQALVAQAIDNLVRGDEHKLDHDVFTKTLRGLVFMAGTCTEALPSILWALGSLTYGHGAQCSSVLEEMLDKPGLVSRHLALANTSIESRRAAANCVGCLYAKLPGERKKEKSSQLDAYAPSLMRLLLDNLTSPLGSDTTASLKHICTCFKAVHNVALRQGYIENSLLPELLAVIKLYMFYETSVTDQSGVYDPLSRILPKTLPVGQPRRPSAQRRSRQFPANSSDSESASDFWSDSQYTAPKGMNSFKIRHTAMMCAQAVIQCGTKNTIFGYWQSFVPETAKQTETSKNIIRAILVDPVPKGRIAALGVLLELLQGSKQFLSVATENSRETSFQSHSATVGAMVRELHSGILKFLELERVSKAQTQGIKCATALVANTPYERMAAGYVRSLVRSLTQHIKSRDHDVRVAVLTCFGKMLSTSLKPEDHDVLFEVEDNEGSMHSSNKEVPVAIQIFTVANDKAQPVIVRVEAMQSLCVLFDEHPVMGLSSLQSMIDLVKAAASETDGTLRMHAAKLLGGISKALADISIRDRSQTSAQFWVEMLGTLMPALLQDPLPAVRSSACDCMSMIGEQTFAGLPLNVQYLCQTLLLGMTADEVTSVRAAASRAVGVIVLYAGPRDDDLYVMDVANALLETTVDSNLATRIRASWALGNLCDAFVLKREDNSDYAVPGGLLQQLLETSLKAMGDSEKVRPNAVRALGGLGRVLGPNYISSAEGQQTVLAISEALSKSISTGPVKVRWNAAYGFGNMFKNSSLGSFSSAWGVTALQSLLSAIRSAPNFKVRINAAAAIAVPSTRDAFEDNQLLANTVETLIESLENIDNMEDFSEFKYQATLRTQLATTLSHILTLVGSSCSDETKSMLLKILSESPERGDFVCCEIGALADVPQLLIDLGFRAEVLDASTPTPFENHGPDSLPPNASPH